MSVTREFRGLVLVASQCAIELALASSHLTRSGLDTCDENARAKRDTRCEQFSAGLH